MISAWVLLRHTLDTFKYLNPDLSLFRNRSQRREVPVTWQIWNIGPPLGPPKTSKQEPRNSRCLARMAVFAPCTGSLARSHECFRGAFVPYVLFTNFSFRAIFKRTIFYKNHRYRYLMSFYWNKIILNISLKPTKQKRAYSLSGLKINPLRRHGLRRVVSSGHGQKRVSSQLA